MRISELIEALEELKESRGDLEAVVKYRDDGGCYPGYDTNIAPFYDDEEDCVVL